MFCQTVPERRGVGLTVRCPKVNKQARLVERKVCFNSDASNLGVRADICPKANSPHRTFIGWGRGGLHAEQQSQLQIVTGGLTSVVLIVLDTVNLQSGVCLFPFV